MPAGGGEVGVRAAERHGLRGQQFALAVGRVPGEAAVGGVGVEDGLLEQRLVYANVIESLNALSVGRPSSDQVGGSFTDHDRCGVRVAAHDVRHDRRVCDVEAPYPVNPQFGVDD